MKKILLIAVFGIISAAGLSAQHHSSEGFRYFWLDEDYYNSRPRVYLSLDVDMRFDNREYKSDYVEDLTIFGLRALPQVELRWGRNSLFGGGTFHLDFGDRRYRRNPEVVFYYRYQDARFSAYAGIVPRKEVMGDYPSVFFSDSVRYYDSNIDGALFQYRGRLGYAEIGADWLNMIHGDEREKFVIFSSGKIMTRNRKFFAGYYASMFHHSVSDNDDGVVDNLLAYPYVGFQLLSGSYRPKRHQLLRISAGWIQAMQRDRKYEDEWRSPGGLQASVRFERWKWGAENTFYWGKNLMPLYSSYGPGLYQGDPFYRTEENFYNKTEVFWTPIHSADKKLKVAAVFHYDGKKINSQQLVTFSILLNKETIGRW